MQKQPVWIEYTVDQKTYTVYDADGRILMQCGNINSLHDTLPKEGWVPIGICGNIVDVTHPEAIHSTSPCGVVKPMPPTNKDFETARRRLMDGKQRNTHTERAFRKTIAAVKRTPKFRRVSDEVIAEFIQASRARAATSGSRKIGLARQKCARTVLHVRARCDAMRDMSE